MFGTSSKETDVVLCKYIGCQVKQGTPSRPSDIQSGNTVTENAVSDWRYPLLLISADSVDNLRNNLNV